MNENQKSLDWRFLRRWVLFSTLGYDIGCASGYYIGLFVWVLLYGLFAFIGLPLYTPLAIVTGMGLAGAVSGMWIGLIQWEAIRSKAPHAKKRTWMTLNIVGMAISWAILFSVLMEKSENWIEGSPNHKMLGLLVAGALWGLLAAVIQWYILHGQIKHAAIWFAVNSLCGIVVFVIGWSWILIPYNVTGYRGEYSSLAFFVPSITSIILWPLAGLLYGLITGSLLAWLMREPNQPDELNGHVLVG